MKKLAAIYIVLGLLVSGLVTVSETKAQVPSDLPLPSQARPGSTSNRQAAYASLSQGQRDVMFSAFRQNYQAPIYTQGILNLDDGLVQINCPLAVRIQDSNYIGTVFDSSPNVVIPPPTPSDVDLDADGLGDSFEFNVAKAFNPYYRVSSGEKSGTGLPTFQNNPVLTVATQYGPFPVTSHFRVTKVPGGGPNGLVLGRDGRYYGYLEIDYLTLWNRDDGVAISDLCAALSAGLGYSLDALQGHNWDTERSALLVVAPAVQSPTGPKFSADVNNYLGLYHYSAAHEGEGYFDQSTVVEYPGGLPPYAHLILYLSREKHATYPFNPNGRSFFRIEEIRAAYATALYLYSSGQISQVTYLALLYTLDTVFLGCLAEVFNFSTSLQGRPTLRINVGELSRPINNSPWINDNGTAFPADTNRNVRGKLDPLVFSF